MTKTMQTAIETLKANGGELPLVRGIKGWNINSVYALIHRGVLITVKQAADSKGNFVPSVVKFAPIEPIDWLSDPSKF